MFVSSRAVAEEVVQEAWLGVFKGLDRFEGRSSLKTWIFRILTNTAKTRGEREGRSVPFSSLGGDADDEAPVDADRFLGDGHRWAGHWASSPRNPRDVPEERLLARRGPRAHRRRDRDAAREPARRDHAPRRRRLRRRRGLRRSSASRRSTSACCSIARGRRCALRSRSTWTRRRWHEVAVVTPFRARRRANRRTSAAARSSRSSTTTSRACCPWASGRRSSCT